MLRIAVRPLHRFVRGSWCWLQDPPIHRVSPEMAETAGRTAWKPASSSFEARPAPMTRSLWLNRIWMMMLVLSFASMAHATERRNTALVTAVQKVRMSVVNIHSEKTASSKDTLFVASRGRKVNGMGTGIVIDERGYIVTNYHVVHEVDSLRATLHECPAHGRIQ